jgi:dimethylargininase
MFRHAIVRPPAENFADGLTTADLGKPDFALAISQHRAYCSALAACGLELHWLPPDPLHPDSTFVEDTAILTERGATLCRPGASARAGEVVGVRDTVRRFYRDVKEIEPPATLDGGDICEAGFHFFIGISQRTNEEGARQLAEILGSDGFTTSTVDIRGMHSILHLKSGIAFLDQNRLVVMSELDDRAEFGKYERIVVPPEESYACNCVVVNDRLLMPAGFPNLSQQLAAAGYKPLPLDMSEFRKMNGGLSCLSLRF